MRVVIVTGIYPPDIGGPATHASDLRDALIERGHRVVVLTLERRRRCDARTRARPVAPIVVRGLAGMPPSFVGSSRTADRIDAVYATGMHPAAVAGARVVGLPSVVKIVGDPVWERGRRQGLTEAEFEAFQRGGAAGGGQDPSDGRTS